MIEYSIRVAAGADLPAVVGLRSEAEQWLRESGIRQWTPDYDQFARDVLAASVARCSTWVAEGQGQVIATVSVNGPDPVFWWPEDSPETGLYLGKMIVSRAYAGRRLGDAILNWASQRAAVEGKAWVRLDCRRDNLRLHRYYLQRGFTHVRTVVPTTRRGESGALFQRPAGTLTDTSIMLVTQEGRGVATP